MATGPQKPDHGGNFYMVPRRVQDSVAWRHLSLRARVVLQVFQYRHDGFNNGKIGIGIHDIGKALGDQNHRANGRAVAELIEKGFLEATSDANRHQSKVRTYRLTFIPTGEGKRVVPATHEYKNWRPALIDQRKFGGARTATQKAISVAVTTTEVKSSVAATTTPSTETRGFEGSCCVAVTAPLIGNQSEGVSSGSVSPLKSPPETRRADLRTDVAELREWTRAARDKIGFGGQKALADAAKIPGGTLSRFLAGKGLPDEHRNNLQQASANVLPYARWRAACAA